MAANTKGTPAPTPNTIRIVQHNCNRSSNVILTILSIAERTADIVLLQEPGFSDPAYATTLGGTRPTHQRVPQNWWI